MPANNNTKNNAELFAPADCIICTSGRGWRVEDGTKEPRPTHFPKNAVGYRTGDKPAKDESIVYFPGKDYAGYYAVPDADLQTINPAQTGKRKSQGEHDNYICNICFVFLPKEKFDINQRDSRGNVVRRPSCQKCRAHLDLKTIPRREEAKWRKNAPRPGALFRCPICRKHSIAHINAKIVLDHDHHHGKIRGWLCDSCNTGLGRFKNGVELFNNARAYLQHDSEE